MRSTLSRTMRRVCSRACGVCVLACVRVCVLNTMPDSRAYLHTIHLNAIFSRNNVHCLRVVVVSFTTSGFINIILIPIHVYS